MSPHHGRMRKWLLVEFCRVALLLLLLQTKIIVSGSSSSTQYSDYYYGFPLDHPAGEYLKRKHEKTEKSKKPLPDNAAKEVKILEFLKKNAPSISSPTTHSNKKTSPNKRKQSDGAKSIHKPPKASPGTAGHKSEGGAKAPPIIANHKHRGPEAHSTTTHNKKESPDHAKAAATAHKTHGGSEKQPKSSSTTESKRLPLSKTRQSKNAKKIAPSSSSDRPKKQLETSPKGNQDAKITTGKLEDSMKSSKSKKSSVSSKKTTKKQQSGPDNDDNRIGDDDLVYDNEQDTCYSAAAQNLVSIVPDAIVWNPSSCCDHAGSIAAYVTPFHPGTHFWRTAYSAIVDLSQGASTCFLFTGIDPSTSTSSSSLEQSLLDVTLTVSTLPEVVTLMVVDITTTTTLVTLLRQMQQQELSIAAPSLVGLWHAGYDNLLIESITRGAAALPYVGVATSDVDAAYGMAAAQRIPLSGDGSAALCVVASTSAGSASECAHWHAGMELRGQSATTTMVCDENFLVPDGVGVVWASSGCCERVTKVSPETIIVGCRDNDDSMATLAIRQPVHFQATTAASWSNAAVVASRQGGSGKYAFPALGTVVATELEPVLSLAKPPR